MYGGSGASPAGAPSSRTSQRPSPRCSTSSTAPSRIPGRRRLRRPGERLPEAVPDRLQQEDLGLAPGRPPHAQPRRDDAGVVDDDERAAGKLLREVAEAPVPRLAGRPVVHEEPGVVAPRQRALGDQLRREVVVEL